MASKIPGDKGIGRVLFKVKVYLRLGGRRGGRGGLLTGGAKRGRSEKDGRCRSCLCVGISKCKVSRTWY